MNLVEEFLEILSGLFVLFKWKIDFSENFTKEPFVNE